MDQSTRSTPGNRRLRRANATGLWLAAAICGQLIAARVAVAEQQTSSPQDCRPWIAAHRTVAHQTGPASFKLDDGSEIVLAGLLVATVHDSNADVASWPPENVARQAIEQLTIGASAGIARTAAVRDRYGRLRSHVFLHRDGHEQWLQALLLRQGHARLEPEGLTRTCAKLLLAAEAKARLARRGLWQHAAYQIRRAERPRTLLRYRNTFQIVEGTVRRVSHRGSRSFINFGTHWRADFTAGMPASLARKATIDGVPLTALAGRSVQIRGWVRRRGGPFISVRSLSQVQLLSHGEAAGRFGPQRRLRRQPDSQTQKRPAKKRPGAAFKL